MNGKIALITLALLAGIVFAASPWPISTYCNIATGIPNPTGIVNVVAPWYCSSINTNVVNVWATWSPLAALAVLGSFLIGAIIFTVGRLANSRRMVEFGIGEIYESFASAMLVFAFLFVTAIMLGVIPALTVGPLDPYVYSLTYIGQTLNTTIHVNGQLFQTLNEISVIQSVDFKVYNFECTGSNGCGIIDLPKAILAAIFGYLFQWPAQSIFGLLNDAIYSLFVQYYLILILMNAAIPVFLIPGVFLRTMLPTRALGGLMMATAIGFFIIMPVLYSVAYYFTSRGALSTLEQVSSVLSSGNAQTQSYQITSAASPLVLALGQIKTTFGAFWLMTLFFPALIVGMTYAFIVVLGDMIGGTVTGGGRILTLI